MAYHTALLSHEIETKSLLKIYLYGQTFAHSFTNKGTYIYHCDLQGQIAMGKVIVI